MVSTLQRMKRATYIPYYVAKTDYRRMSRCMLWVRCERKRSYLIQALDVLQCSLLYGMSFIDYYDLALYDMQRAERLKVAGTAVAHDFHVALNAKGSRSVFRSKAEFLKAFGSLMQRESLHIPGATIQTFAGFVGRHPDFVAKPSLGTRGKGIAFVSGASQNPSDLREQLLSAGLDLVEEVIHQHQLLSEIYPGSVNTVRVITVCSEDAVDIIGAVLKLGVGARVDNMGQGGIAAPVDAETGVVSGPARSKDPWTKPYETHPITGAQIAGVQLPYWDQVCDLCRRAAGVVPSVRTVGWDIAIGVDGPELVEGNDNWGKTLWLLPTGIGGLETLRRYADV